MKNLSFTLNHQTASDFLKLYPTYAPSPILDKNLGELSYWLKDETNRMGLGAFKGLGGIYAVARLIMGEEVNPSQLNYEAIREKASQLTFVCASAGNHGMAVAAGANLFGAKARIHLSATVPTDFTQRLESKGAEVIRSGDTYEESIKAAIKDASDNEYVHLADGSWQGYTEPPRLVMEGYTVMAEELRQFFEAQAEWPTHVFLQAGVGGMAAAIAYMIRKNWTIQPKIIIVEPDNASCLKDSAEVGSLITVEGPISNMGRLDCKTPSILAFEILQSAANQYVTITDDVAQEAANELSKNGLPTTPSGAAGYAAMQMLDLPSNKKPLVIVSEGQVK